MNRSASRRQLGPDWNRRGERQAGSMTRAVGAARSTRHLLWTTVCAIGAWCAAGTTESFGAEGQAVGPEPKLLQTTVERAIAYQAKQQDDDGSLSSQMGIGPTALTTLGLLRNGRGVADPPSGKGVEVSGGIPAGRRRNSSGTQPCAQL